MGASLSARNEIAIKAMETSCISCFKDSQVSDIRKSHRISFWDSEGVLLINCLSKGQTVTGSYYANLLRQLWQKIKENRRGKLSLGVLFHQDNAPAHKSAEALAAIHDCGFQLVEHLRYSQDLAPSDYYLFPKLKSYSVAIILQLMMTSLLP